MKQYRSPRSPCARKVMVAALEAEGEASAAATVGIAQITVAMTSASADFRFPHLGWRAQCPQLAAWESSLAARPSMRATAFKEG